MKKVCLIMTLLCTNMVYAQPGILVDADWLSKRMQSKNLVLIEIGEEDHYKKEHIPGAQFIRSSDYTFDDRDNNIVFDLPPNEDLKALFERLGISNNTDVVVYASNNWRPIVTRLYFTLDYLGHGHKSYILDGGLAAWKGAGKEVTSDIVEPSPGTFRLEPNDKLLASTDDIRMQMDKKSSAIIDCRSEVYYRGLEPTHGARPGHIPGAINIPYTDLYAPAKEGTYKFISLAEMETLFKDKGLKKNEPLILYCHIGMQMTVVYFAAKMQGYQHVKVYDDSFNVWGKDETLPVQLDE